jgi:hypothetical protein
VKRPSLELSGEERRTLNQLASDPKLDPAHARRVRVILLSADGVPGAEIAKRLSLSPGQVSRIRRRFAEHGVSGLATRPHLGRKDHAVSPETTERVGLTSATVAKVLRRAGSSTALTMRTGANVHGAGTAGGSVSRSAGGGVGRNDDAG